MKNSILITIVLTIILLSFLSCSSGGIKDPDKIGQQVFQILINSDKDGKQGYINNLASYQEISKIYSDVTEKDWNSHVDSRYDDIEEFENKWKIDWSSIEFSKFDFELSESEYGKECNGVLYFKFKDGLKYGYDREATIKTTSIFMEGKYILIELRQIGLYVQHKDIDELIKEGKVYDMDGKLIRDN